MEAGERVVGGSEWTGIQADAFAVEQAVVNGLHHEERGAQDDRHGDRACETPAVISPDCPHADLARERRDDQEDGGRPHERQDVQLVVEIDRRPDRRIRPNIEVGGEEPREEHHLGGDEQQHPQDDIADAALAVGHRRVCVGGLVRRTGREGRGVAGHQCSDCCCLSPTFS